jgi:hypothetical protein
VGTNCYSLTRQCSSIIINFKETQKATTACARRLMRPINTEIKRGKVVSLIPRPVCSMRSMASPCVHWWTLRPSAHGRGAVGSRKSAQPLCRRGISESASLFSFLSYCKPTSITTCSLTISRSNPCGLLCAFCLDTRTGAPHPHLADLDQLRP